MVDDLSLLPGATRETPVIATASGFVHRVDARRIGMAAVALGAGRRRKEDPVDPGAAVILEVEVGSPVAPGDLLARLRYNPGADVPGALTALGDALAIAEGPPVIIPPVLEVMR
jgi:thymidine phosphorylase